MNFWIKASPPGNISPLPNWPADELNTQVLKQKLETVEREPEKVITDQMKWEQGHPDFHGVHSFENILQRLQPILQGSENSVQDKCKVEGEYVWGQDMTWSSNMMSKNYTKHL